MAHDHSGGVPFRSVSLDSRVATSLDPTFSAELRQQTHDLVLRRTLAKLKPGAQVPLLMPHLFTLTTSSFLKWTMLSEKALKIEIASRLTVDKRNAYDRYKNLKKLIARAICEGESLEALVVDAEKIRNKFERRDTLSALHRLFDWLKTLSEWMPFVPRQVYWTSFNGLFRVKVKPEAGLTVRGERKTLSTYNTIDPNLTPEVATIGCALIREAYRAVLSDEEKKDAVFALQAPTAYELPSADEEAARELLKRAVLHIELAILDVLDEG